jgi:predicted MFS family arabinose efflux permease
MIADYYPPQQRSQAYSIYSAGSYLGLFFGYLCGGWISQFYGWRVAFMFAGLPGIALALLLRLTVAEPARGRTDAAGIDKSLPALGPTLRFLLARRSYVLIVLGGALMGVTLYSFSTWVPSVLRRLHHMSDGEIGSYAGLIKGLLGLLGALSGGFVVERLARGNEQRKLVIAGLGCMLACPPLLLFLFAESQAWSLVGLGLSALFTPFSMGPMWAVMQSVVKLRMRAIASAVFLFCTMMLGLGVGPLAVGYMNDRLALTHGSEAIRYSLLAPAFACVFAGLGLMLAARWVERDIQRSARND